MLFLSRLFPFCSLPHFHACLFSSQTNAIFSDWYTHLYDYQWVHNYDKAYNIVFKVGANINKNVDIKFSVQRRLLESHSSGTLKVERLEDQIHVI